LLVWLTALSACSTLPASDARLNPASKTPPTNTTETSPADRVWSGRFAVEGSPELAPASGRFTLERFATRRRLDLLGPLGQVLARLDMSAEGARLTRADGQIELAEDANELVAHALGWRLPVTQMERWLDGEFTLVTERATDGSPRSAIDSEWRIRIDPPRRWAFEWPADLNPSPALMPERRVRVRLLLDP